MKDLSDKGNERSMTNEAADAWAFIAPKYQIRRLIDWANMLERRVKELDPSYRTYQWGRRIESDGETE